MFLFAGDQKVEHLNKDFYGKGIPEECGHPEHMFQIASEAPITAFATQLGLVSQYCGDYPSIHYVIKLNSKTDLIPKSQKDPLSLLLHSVQDVVEFKKQSGATITGVGYTVYLGSEYEAQMLTEAAQVVYQAHKHGLKAILWMYPRGKAIKNERDADLIAGAAGVAACLGADYVKVNMPEGGASALKEAVRAAGRTKVICAGGEKVDEKTFLQELKDQIAVGAAGCAIGRNIHQRSKDDAVAFCKRVKAILSGGKV